MIFPITLFVFSTIEFLVISRTNFTHTGALTIVWGLIAPFVSILNTHPITALPTAVEGGINCDFLPGGDHAVRYDH